MTIALSGLPFDTTVISELEQALSQQGFDLNAFAFEKATKRVQVSTPLPRSLDREYDYTVSVSGKNFSIAFSDDVQFARFFYNLCCSEDRHSTIGDLLDRVIKRVEDSAEATKHWLLDTSLKPQ